MEENRGDENVLRILGIARFGPASQENAVPGLKNSCRLPLHFSFTNDLGTSASAFDSKKEAGKKSLFPLSRTKAVGLRLTLSGVFKCSAA